MNKQVIPETDNDVVAKIAVAANLANAIADRLLNARKAEEVVDEWIKHFKRTYKAIDEVTVEASDEISPTKMVQIPSRSARRSNGA